VKAFDTRWLNTLMDSPGHRATDDGVKPYAFFPRSQHVAFLNG